MEIAVIGLDLAKHVFQGRCQVDEGEGIARVKLARPHATGAALTTSRHS